MVCLGKRKSKNGGWRGRIGDDGGLKGLTATEQSVGQTH